MAREGVRFIRVHGRVVPIRTLSKNEAKNVRFTRVRGRVAPAFGKEGARVTQDRTATRHKKIVLNLTHNKPNLATFKLRTTDIKQLKADRKMAFEAAIKKHRDYMVKKAKEATALVRAHLKPKSKKLRREDAKSYVKSFIGKKK